MPAHRFLMLAPIAILMAAGCTDSAPPPKAIEIATPAEGPFDKDLLKVAGEYLAWGRVDDAMRWAPEMCEQLPPPSPAFSLSKDEASHGKKLYSLFVKHADSYRGKSKEKTTPADQIVVKQSWVPEEISQEKEQPPKQGVDEKLVIRAKIPNPQDGGKTFIYDRFYPYIWKFDKCYKASQQADLFIMMKLDATTPGTDEGWVYATVTPDGKKVNAAGRIESCMKCHQEAKHDRLFGLRK